MIDHAVVAPGQACSTDWNGRDFAHHADQTRLKVKQSAVLRSWPGPATHPSDRPGAPA